MDSYSSKREVEKPLTRKEQRTLRREQGRLMAQTLRMKSDYLHATFGQSPLVDVLRVAADLLEQIVKDYTPAADGTITDNPEPRQ